MMIGAISVENFLKIAKKSHQKWVLLLSMAYIKIKSPYNVKRSIIILRFHTQRSFILYHVLNVEERKENNGKSNWDKKKNAEMKCTKRGKENFLNKLGLRWKEVEILMIVVIVKIVLLVMVLVPPHRIPPRLVEMLRISTHLLNLKRILIVRLRS